MAVEMFLGPDHMAIRTELPIGRFSRSSRRLADRGTASSAIITVADRLAEPAVPRAPRELSCVTFTWRYDMIGHVT